MFRKAPFALLVGCGLLLPSTAILAEVGGEKGAETEHLGDLALGSDRDQVCRFSIKIDEVTFQLNSFHDKYKIVRMRVQNNTDSRISLSREKDQIDARDSGGRVTATGILDLSREDPTLWDALDVGLRRDLAYPVLMEGNRVVYLFVFFPKEKLTKAPSSFEYKIDSLGKTITIKPRPVARR